MTTRRPLAAILVSALSLAAAATAAEPFDRQLQRVLDAGDLDGALRIAALDGSPADLRFFYLDLVRECGSGKMTCRVELAPFSADEAQRNAEAGTELPVPPLGDVVVHQAYADGMGSGEMRMPYGTVGGQLRLLGGRLTPAKLAALRGKSNESLMDEVLEDGIVESGTGALRTDWKQAAQKLPAGGGEAGAFLVRRAEALQRAAAANDPDAAAAAGGRWLAMVFGAESFGTPVPRRERELKLRTQSERFLRDVRVLGGYQLGDDALLLVEASNAIGWMVRGPILVSRDESGLDVAADLTISHPR